jgi:hypothetical protein
MLVFLSRFLGKKQDADIVLQIIFQVLNRKLFNVGISNIFKAYKRFFNRFRGGN